MAVIKPSATSLSTGANTAGNGLGPKTRIINLAKSNMTQAELDAALTYLAAGDVAGTNDAHTVAGISVLTESGQLSASPLTAPSLQTVSLSGSL